MPRRIPTDRFEELLRAATAVFLEQGYRRTQMADVAERLGVAKGSVYTYVESKEALLDLVLRHADRTEPVALPERLPVPTPSSRATLAALRKRMAREGALPALRTARGRARVRDTRAELELVLGELYDALARHRISIKLMDRCAPDYPELARLWFRAGRQRALALLTRLFERRARGGRLRRFEDPQLAARLVLETLTFWAVHRHFDPAPQRFDETTVRRNVLAFLIAALSKQTR